MGVQAAKHHTDVVAAPSDIIHLDGMRCVVVSSCGFVEGFVCLQTPKEGVVHVRRDFVERIGTTPKASFPLLMLPDAVLKHVACLGNNAKALRLTCKRLFSLLSMPFPTAAPRSRPLLVAVAGLPAQGQLGPREALKLLGNLGGAVTTDGRHLVLYKEEQCAHISLGR